MQRNAAEAARWLLAAAEQGFAKSQENIGLVYLDGDGVEQNDELAAKWLTQAALQGQMKAQLTLGLMTLAGRGVAESQNQGMKWIEQSAERGSVQAAMALAKAYEQGLYGKPKDIQQAKHWYQRAGQPLQ